MKYILFPFFLLLISCDKYDNRLSIINNTKNDVYYCIQSNDVLIPTENNHFSHDSYFIPKESSKTLIVPSDTYKNLFFESKDSCIYLYIFNPDTLSKYNKLQIVDKQNFVLKLKIERELLNKNKMSIPIYE